MTPRLPLLVAALALVAAACTGSAGSTTTAAATPASSTSTTTTTTADPATTTTSGPPPEPPYTLTFDLEPGTAAIYDFETTYKDTSSGELAAEAITVELDGQRRIAAYELDGRTYREDLLDVGSVAVFGTAVDGEDATGRGLAALTDAGLDAAALQWPVTVVVESDGRAAGGLAPVAGGTAQPMALARALDSLAVPILPPGPVEAGDEWPLGPLELPWIGVEPMTATGTARVAGTSALDGAFVVDVEVDLTLSAPTHRFADLAAGLLEVSPTDGRLMGIDRLLAERLAAEAAEGEAAGTVGLASGRIAGTYRFDPARGLLAGASTDSRVVVELAFEDERGPFAGTAVIEARTDARLARVGGEVPPLPQDPDDAAFTALPLEHPGFVVEDLDPLRAEELLNRVGLLLDDPLAGATAARLVPPGSDDTAVDVMAFYPLGFARGDPLLAATLAAVVTGEFEVDVGEPVDADGATVIRFESEGETWLVAVTNTRLLVGVGGDDVDTGAFLEAVAYAAEDHRWAEGECHDLGDGEAFDPPFSPFGTETLVPCWRPHSVEVTAAELVAGDPGSPRPDDLDARSERLCDEAFLDYTGSLPSQTRLSGISYLPDEAEWAEGDRYLACVVSAVDDEGLVAASAGSLQDAGDRFSLELEAGVCFDGPLSSIPVECSGPHVVEIVGTVARDDPPGAPYPGDDELITALDEQCTEALAGYASDVAKDGAEIEAAAFGVGAFAWEQGVRDFACTAVARDADGASVRVTRSFADEWRPLGPADDAFSA